MASEVECSQVGCLPPIPSGYYTIVNKVNGNINLSPIKPTEIPVVANPEALIVSRFTDRFTNSGLKVFICTVVENRTYKESRLYYHGTVYWRSDSVRLSGR